MRLTLLEAQFVRRERREDGHVYHVPVSTLAEAHGMFFLCPKCFEANGGAMGTHRVLCWFEGRVPEDAQPGPGRWNPVGSGLEDLSFVPGVKSHSVLLLGGCAWHGFVTNGDAA